MELEEDSKALSSPVSVFLMAPGPGDGQYAACVVLGHLPGVAFVTLVIGYS